MNLSLSGRARLGIPLVAAFLLSMAPGNTAILFPMTVATAVVILAAVIKLPSFLQASSDYLGELSYPLYLLHHNVGYILLLTFAAWRLPNIAGFFITLAIVVTSASLIAYKFDRPLRKFLRSISNAKSSEAKATS